MEGKAVPTAIQVNDVTFERFKYLESFKVLTDPNIPDYIIKYSESSIKSKF